MRNKLVVALLLVGAVAVLPQAPAGGQRQESLKGGARKNQAPVSMEILRVKLPRPVERRLKNGLPLLILENHRVPTVAFDLVLSASTLNDPPGLSGVAEAVAEMLKQGTRKRSAREIADSIAELGASINAVAEYGARSTHVYASALKENLDPLLDLVSDVLLNPAFPQDELDKWSKRKLGQLEQMRSSEYFLGSERMYQVLYGGDGRAITAATPESVKKMTREDLVAYYKKYYVPGSAILGVTGDVTPDEITRKLETYLAAWKSGRATDPDLAVRPPIPEKKIYLVNRPNSVQTFLTLANHAINRLSPDYVPCMVLNEVLGSGPASRLFLNIREEKGFTYGVYSSFAALRYLEHFQADSSVRTEVTAPAIDEFLKEFRRIREEPVSKDELDAAKRAIVGRFALSLESQGYVLRQHLLIREYGLLEDYWDTYPEKVIAVTAAEIQRAARKYIPLDNVQIVAVGDAGKIRDLLKKYGPVEEYDTEGQKVP